MRAIFTFKKKTVAKAENILRHYLADIVYGATDGIISTFTIISGVEGAKLAPFIAVILGLVNLFADGVSMGASNYLSVRTDIITQKYPDNHKIPIYHAITTFFAFLIFGAMPLISFLIPRFYMHRFVFSCIMTVIVLMFVGSLRALVTEEKWYMGAFEMLTIGGIAALIAYAIGHSLAFLI